MKKKSKLTADLVHLDRQAANTSDIGALSATMRGEWEAAKKTGAARKGVRRGRPPKEPATKSRIVPISIEPELLRAVDRYAKDKGYSQSKLIADALRLRMMA